MAVVCDTGKDVPTIGEDGLIEYQRRVEGSEPNGLDKKLFESRNCKDQIPYVK